MLSPSGCATWVKERERSEHVVLGNQAWWDDTVPPVADNNESIRAPGLNYLGGTSVVSGGMLFKLAYWPFISLSPQSIISVTVVVPPQPYSQR